jgi:hypothetical protein
MNFPIWECKIIHKVILKVIQSNYKMKPKPSTQNSVQSKRDLISTSFKVEAIQFEQRHHKLLFVQQSVYLFRSTNYMVEDDIIDRISSGRGFGN